jgi:hypothetical protein
MTTLRHGKATGSYAFSKGTMVNHQRRRDRWVSTVEYEWALSLAKKHPKNQLARSIIGYAKSDRRLSRKQIDALYAELAGA